MSDLARIAGASLRCRCGHLANSHRKENFGYCTHGECYCIKFVFKREPQKMGTNAE